MYLPGHFKEDDPTALHALMKAFPFALLVSVIDGAPYATHLPLVLDAGRGAKGTLRMHVARANPHWRGLEIDPACLLVFQGPSAYVSPGWYDKHPSVPTWNYTAVHAYGRAQVMEDGALRKLLDDLSAVHEATQLEPWTSAKLTEEWFANQRKAIVGLEVEIERLEGKFKLSQNRPEGDRRNVIEALSRGNESARGIAAMMRQREEA